MALSKYRTYLLDSSPFFAQDIIIPKIAISETNKSRYKDGEYHKLYKKIRYSDKEFFKYTGISRKTFDYILENVKDKLTSFDTNYRTNNIIDAEEKLVVTLRFMAAGPSYAILARNFCMGRSTVAKVIYQTCEVIWECLHERHMPKPNPEYLKNISKDFWRKYQFPNCIGVIGERSVKGTKKKSNQNLPSFLSFPSYVIQGIADADCKFIAIEVVGRKTKHDETFNGSKINRRLQNNYFGVPSIQQLPDSDMVLPHVILGNKGYPLTRYLIRPYHERDLNPEKRKFNKKIAQTRKPVKCAFEMLFTRWQTLSMPMAVNLKNTQLVIQATCLLHNVVLDIDGNSVFFYKKCIDNCPEAKAQPHKANNRPSSEALIIRDNFLKYFLANLQQGTSSNNDDGTSLLE